MTHIARFVPQTIAALVMVLPIFAQAGPHSRVLDEDGALALLEQTLKHDGVYAHRISLNCIICGTEETTDASFQFVLRENHNAKCGGDPETNPVVDRYRVYRKSEKIARLERVEDNWQPYNPGEIR
jgi:hypothetical protein